MSRTTRNFTALFLAIALNTLTHSAQARGLGGHGGMGGGGFGGGRAGGLGGGGFGEAGFGGGGLGPAAMGGGGLGPGGLAGRAAGIGGGPLGGAELGNFGAPGGGDRLGGFNQLNTGALPGRGGDIASELRAAGLGSGGAGAGLANRAEGGGALGPGGAPSRSQVASFLGLPSDNGMHSLSGETQSRLSQAYDNARAGDGPLSKDLSGETQSKLSQLYDDVKAGDGPRSGNLSGETQSKLSQLYDDARESDGQFKNFIPGETQSKLSQLYDNVKAGDGPFSHYIPGETQKPLSRLYDQIRGGNRPFQPWSPWIIHNNAVVIRRNFNNYYIFTPNWYRHYPTAWYPPLWAYGDPWLYAPWPRLYVWIGCSSQPMYYNYGTNVVYQDNSIYLNGQDVGTSQQYYQQAEQLANSGAGDSSAEQWMPLGVFALSDSGQQSANLILQLAVDKQGILRGNMTNLKANTNEVVHGAVDKQTQRAAWTVGDDTNTVFETGIYNLTKDETPVIVHMADDQTEQLLLVRLQQQNQPSGQSQLPDNPSGE